MGHLSKFFIIGALITGAGCATAPAKPVDPYPSWYLAPEAAVPNALNAASCVAIPAGNMDIARKQAVANGRADIAAQIDVRVKAMDKTYDSLVTTDGGQAVGGTFTSVSKQVVNQKLSGIRTIQTARVMDAGRPYLCVLTSLDTANTKELISEILANSGQTLSPTQESVLRQQFNAHKAEQELDDQISKQ